MQFNNKDIDIFLFFKMNPDPTQNTRIRNSPKHITDLPYKIFFLIFLAADFYLNVYNKKKQYIFHKKRYLHTIEIYEILYFQ